VAAVACGRVTGCDVIWNRTPKCLRAVPLRHVTSIAGGIRCRQRVVVVYMAIGTRLHAARRGNHVTTSECPSSSAVIEFAIGPGDRVMACGA